MKAAFVSVSMSRLNGGLFECMRRMAATLVTEQAVDMEVLAIADAYSVADLPAWLPLDVHIFPAQRMPGMSVSLAMRGHLRKLKADLLHTQGLWSYASIGVHAWASRTKQPYLISPHGMLDAWALANSRWKKRIAACLFERRHLEDAACLHALCAAEANAIRAYGLRNPICVIPNGVDLSDIHSIQPCSPPWADAAAAGRKAILYLGRIHPKKGLANLLKAWAAVRSKAPADVDEWMLIIAGWDQNGHLAQLQQLVREFSLENSVNFIGPLFGDAKGIAYRCAQAFVLPSLSEGLPLVILEAWSYGLPVIMTPACNLPEGFAAGAALESGPSPEELAATLATLISTNEEDRRRMGERGRALVENRFTWSSAASKMAQVYRWVLGDGERPEFVVVSAS